MTGYVSTKQLVKKPHEMDPVMKQRFSKLNQKIKDLKIKSHKVLKDKAKRIMLELN